MRVLVTGGTGFIGSWLLRALHREGHEVVLLYRTKQALEELAPFVKYGVRGDVTDPRSLKEALASVEAVYHLAGVVGYDPRERSLMERVNVQGTRHIVEAALAAQVQRFVHLSSVVAVGASFDQTVLDESSPYNLSHLNMGYFETKRQAEQIVLKAAHEEGLPALCLNPATVYGSGDALKGSRKMQVKVARGELSVYPPGGVNVVHIQDVVDCLIKALHLGQVGERYILSGENLLLKDLFERIARIAGVHPPRWKLPKPLILSLGQVGDLMNRCGLKGPLTSENAWAASLYHWFDSSKAQKTFGFQPRSVDLALKESVAWMKENGLLKK